MSRQDIITGIDFGTTTIRIVVGQQREQLHIIGAVDVPAEGVTRGVITSIEDAVSSLSAGLEKAERITGVPIEHAWVAVSGIDVVTQTSKGVVAISKPNGEIVESDVQRAIEAAQAIALPPNFQTLHVLPKAFTVDNQNGVKDPVGMTGVRLEVDVQIIQALATHINNLTKCIYRSGLDIDDLVLGIMAAAETVLTARQKELGVAVINIGGPTTSMAVYEEGDCLLTQVLPIGSQRITSDLAIGLRTSPDTAERVKREYGNTTPDVVGKKEEIAFADVGASEEGMFSLRYVAEIIEARVEEIFENIDKELRTISRDGRLPAGVVLTGSGSKLPGIVDVAKRILRLPVQIGQPHDLVSPIDKITEASYSTALGLVIWGSHFQTPSSGLNLSRFTNVEAVSGQLKKWFKSLLP